MALVVGARLVVTLKPAVHGGVFAAGVYAYPILVVICGWTPGMRVTLALAILTIATEAMLTIAGIQGLISQAPAPAPWQWAVHAVLLVGALGFAGFSIGAYDDQIEYIRALSAELALKVADIEVKNREQEQQTLHYRTLLDAQSDAGLGLLMIRNRRITFVNQAVSQMLDYSHEELMALPSYTQLLHPDDLKRVALNHERRLRGESFENRYDIVVKTKSGERREAEITVAILPGEDEPEVLIILADIHERKRVERELSHSREMFSHVFQSKPTAAISMSIPAIAGSSAGAGKRRSDAARSSSASGRARPSARAGRRNCAGPVSSPIGPPRCAIAAAGRSAWPSRPRYLQSRTSRWCFPSSAITPICGRPRPACGKARSASAACFRPAP